MGGGSSAARKQRATDKALLRKAAKLAQRQDLVHVNAESEEAVDAVRAAIGGLIEVESETFGGWTWAYVAAISEEEANASVAGRESSHKPPSVELRYGQRTKIVQLQPGWSAQLRNPLALKAVAEVNSASFGGWVPASLLAATATEAALQYGERTKLVRLGHPEDDPRVYLRKPTPAKERHM